MAEIRKFTPGKGGDIAQALAKAMGESVRPVAPGATPPEKKPRPRTPAGPTATSGAIWDPFLQAQPAKKAPRADS